MRKLLYMDARGTKNQSMFIHNSGILDFMLPLGLNLSITRVVHTISISK